MQENKEFIAGTVAGFAQVLSGQPFDIIKVRLQANPGKFLSAWDCFQNIIKQEGVTALYKGSIFPLLLTGTASSIQFGVNEKMRNIIGKESFAQLYVAGMVSGVFGAFVICPMEHLRIRLQQLNSPYKSSMDVIQKIGKEFGVKGIYKGLGATFARDSFYGAYFGFYEISMRFQTDQQGSRKWYSTVISSIIAGFCFWTFNFPLDTIKTLLQSDSLQNPKYKGILDCGQQVVKSQGIKGLFNGYFPCQARSAPVNVVIFTTYEQTLAIINRQQL